MTALRAVLATTNYTNMHKRTRVTGLRALEGMVNVLRVINKLISECKRDLAEIYGTTKNISKNFNEEIHSNYINT